MAGMTGNGGNDGYCWKAVLTIPTHVENTELDGRLEVVAGGLFVGVAYLDEGGFG